MNIKHIILSVFVSSLFWTSAHAQSVDDAIVLSKEDNGGSARMKGLGNVQTALGGDISSINGNPAGLGFFSRSDISVTLGYLGNKNKTNYLGTNSSSSKGNFGIDQAGVVFNFPTYNAHSGAGGWQNFNVGLSYNKSQNFNNNLTYEGMNNSSTIVNALTDIMSGSFETDFAGSNIVERFPDSDMGYFPLAKMSADKDQYNNIITKGNRGKTTFSFGSNYSNTFYIGAALGLTSFRYEKSAQFIENGWTKNRAEILADNPNSKYADPNDSLYDFVEASYELFDNNSQVTEGSGIDLKLGMIFKPTTDWNIGITINTPTWMTIKDDSRIYTDINFYDNETAETPFEFYESDFYDNGEDYNLTTPWKFAAGLTKFFNRGLLTTDVEYVTYNTMKYSTANYAINNDYQDINGDIKDLYKGAINFKIGGEYLFTNILSGRAGFNYFGNPYKGGIEDKNYSGSLGLGVKLSNSFYMDLAVVHQIHTYNEASYLISEDFWNAQSPVASIERNRTNAVMTFGARF